MTKARSPGLSKNCWHPPLKQQLFQDNYSNSQHPVDEILQKRSKKTSPEENILSFMCGTEINFVPFTQKRPVPLVLNTCQRNFGKSAQQLRCDEQFGTFYSIKK